MTAHGLIDTTEMYLRTVFELEEEGIVPLRARIAERLSQSGPTVSQTVARMERDGLLHVAGDRQLALTDAGRTLATRVMRKHRLAECLLVSRDPAALGRGAHRGLPLGARDLGKRGAAPVRAARPPGPVPARQPHPRSGELGDGPSARRAGAPGWRRCRRGSPRGRRPDATMTDVLRDGAGAVRATVTGSLSNSKVIWS